MLGFLVINTATRTAGTKLEYVILSWIFGISSICAAFLLASDSRRRESEDPKASDLLTLVGLVVSAILAGGGWRVLHKFHDA